MYKLYQYNDNQFRIICINNNSNNIKYTEDNEDNNESLRCSLSRSKRMIREYCMCNKFVWFFTCTVSSSKCDRYSLDECQDNIKKCMKAIKRKNNDFKYILITEKHKDGAFHFHGLCNDLYDLYINDNGYYSCSILDKLGFNSFSLIKDNDKVSNYILKYITKDCVRNSSRYCLFLFAWS